MPDSAPTHRLSVYQLGVVLDLGPRAGEQFLYEYDFFDGWWRRSSWSSGMGCYPVCTSGRRSAPPAGCGGAWAFLELKADPDHRVREVLGDRYEEMEELCRCLRPDRLDRGAANRRLAAEMVNRARSLA